MSTSIPKATAYLFDALLNIAAVTRPLALYDTATETKPIATLYVEHDIYNGIVASLEAGMLFTAKQKRNSLLINNIRIRPRLRRS